MNRKQRIIAELKAKKQNIQGALADSSNYDYALDEAIAIVGRNLVVSEEDVEQAAIVLYGSCFPNARHRKTKIHKNWFRHAKAVLTAFIGKGE